MADRKFEKTIRDWCADFEKTNPNEINMTQFFSPDIEKKMLEYLVTLGINTTQDSLYAFVLGMLEGLKHIEPIAKEQQLTQKSNTYMFILATKIYTLQKYRESREKAMKEALDKQIKP